MTSLNSEAGEKDAGDKENLRRPHWKRTGLGLESARDYPSSTLSPQSTRTLGIKAPNSNPTPRSLTARNTDKTFFASQRPLELPRYEPAKCSVKENGIVKSYAATTNQGLVRTYNEDRVSIILNVIKPPSRALEVWPRCSFFGVYDGHGGSACADYLRDNLHQYVVREPTFPGNPKEALRRGFENAERRFLELIEARSTDAVAERSGSCALVVLIVGEMCYVANVGDSRAVLSGDGGKRVFALSQDHKPCTETEQARIVNSGGQIYQSQVTQTRCIDGNLVSESLLGPYRVLPGRLSVISIQVSRTFGDTEAKLAKFGGNPNVIIAVPEIKSFRVTPDHDFILLASDGIYDKLSNKEIIQGSWNALKAVPSADVHQLSGLAVEAVMRLAFVRRSLDNVTVVMIGLAGLVARLTPATN